MLYLMFVIVVGFAAACAILAPEFWNRFWARKPTVILSQGPTLERLQRLCHLVTSRVYVADVLTAEGDGYRGAWLVKGDCMIGIDLSQARIVKKREHDKHAILQFPSPEVLQSRLDHERTKTWEVKRTTWIPWRGDQDKLRDCAMLHAQRLIEHVARSPDNITLAKMAAEAAVRGFYAEFGWRVEVVWAGGGPESPARLETASGSSSTVNRLSAGLSDILAGIRTLRNPVERMEVK
jgi:hypothetical protein